MPRSASQLFIVLLVVCLGGLSPVTAPAWGPTGHHVIAVLAYETMPPSDREIMMSILGQHPQFDQIFTLPADQPATIADRGGLQRWQIGVAGCWPDIIRGSEFDRPTWHYELGATLVLEQADAPESPGPLPPDADLETQSLHVMQAIDLCRGVYADPSRPTADRAIALCWLLHLIADLHQPCHAGSLYAPVIDDGDRGANRLRFRGGGNLHGAWDRLLGGAATPGDVRRRVGEMGIDSAAVQRRFDAMGPDHPWLRPDRWLDESRIFGRSHVYTAEVLEPIGELIRQGGGRLPKYQLSDGYFRAAGVVAIKRAKQAGIRLAAVIQSAHAEATR